MLLIRFCSNFKKIVSREMKIFFLILLLAYTLTLGINISERIIFGGLEITDDRTAVLLRISVFRYPLAVIFYYQFVLVIIKLKQGLLIAKATSLDELNDRLENLRRTIRFWK